MRSCRASKPNSTHTHNSPVTATTIAEHRGRIGAHVHSRLPVIWPSDAPSEKDLLGWLAWPTTDLISNVSAPRRLTRHRYTAW